MSPKILAEQLVRRACLNNEEAMQFLLLWSNYVHGIDDLVDEKTDAEFRIGLFIQALELYNHPFYLKHRLTLNPIIVLVTNLYADSVAWEQSAEAWQQAFSDHARHAGAEMVLAVAGIVGGYPHMRRLSAETRAVNWSFEPGEKHEKQS